MKENEEKGITEDAHFRSMIIAYHLGKAKDILDVIDGARKDETEFAPELTEEEMEDYDLTSEEEAQTAIAMLRSMGVAVQ